MDAVDRRIEVLERRLAMFKRLGKGFTTATVVAIFIFTGLLDKFGNVPALLIPAYVLVALGVIAAICWLGALVTYFTPPE